MKFYAGIGSRRTPPEALQVMEYAAMRLADLGWTLRSGHADGADLTFEAAAGGKAEVYLPWPSFNSREPVDGEVIERPTGRALEIAAEHHPQWFALKQAARLLHARNSHQVLGRDCASPSRFVLCWTPDGSVDGRGPDTGGTGQALRVAAAYGVEVFNLARPEHLERVDNLVQDLIA